jgi:hypothetical protein
LPPAPAACASLAIGIGSGQHAEIAAVVTRAGLYNATTGEMAAIALASAIVGVTVADGGRCCCWGLGFVRVIGAGLALP